MKSIRISTMMAAAALGIGVGATTHIGEASAHTFSQWYDGSTQESTQYRSQRGRTSTVQTNRHSQDAFYTDQQTDAETRMMARPSLAAVRIQQFFSRLAVSSKIHLYDNDDFDMSEVDLQQLIAHHCFNPVRGEIIACKVRFGPYFSLKNSLLDGTFQKILIDDNPNVRADMKMLLDHAMQEVLALQPQEGSLNTGTNASADAENRQAAEGTLFGASGISTIRARSAFVWEVCLSKYQSWMEAAQCYSRNQRLVTNFDAGLHIEADTVADWIQ